MFLNATPIPPPMICIVLLLTLLFFMIDHLEDETPLKVYNVVYYEANGPVLELYPGITMNVSLLDILGEVEGEVLIKIKEFLYHELHYEELR